LSVTIDTAKRCLNFFFSLSHIQAYRVTVAPASLRQPTLRAGADAGKDAGAYPYVALATIKLKHFFSFNKQKVKANRLPAFG